MAFEPLLHLALGLLIIGNGFFKPNISTLLGTLYRQHDPRRDGGFTIFYMGVNLGAFLAPLVAGTLGEKVGWHYGFASAGVGMLCGLAAVHARPGQARGPGAAARQAEARSRRLAADRGDRGRDDPARLSRPRAASSVVGPFWQALGGIGQLSDRRHRLHVAVVRRSHARHEGRRRAADPRGMAADRRDRHHGSVRRVLLDGLRTGGRHDEPVRRQADRPHGVRLGDARRRTSRRSTRSRSSRSDRCCR